jgi:hypothetical protein
MARRRSSLSTCRADAEFSRGAAGASRFLFADFFLYRCCFVCPLAENVRAENVRAEKVRPASYPLSRGSGRFTPRQSRAVLASSFGPMSETRLSCQTFYWLAISLTTSDAKPECWRGRLQPLQPRCFNPAQPGGRHRQAELSSHVLRLPDLDHSNSAVLILFI